jgi:hypothetical protein
VIHAAFDDAERIAYLYVSLPMPLTAVSVNPANVIGGTESTGTVTLSAAAPAGGAIVELSSSDVAVATVPATVIVPAGTTSANFAIITQRVMVSTSVAISGSYAGVTKGTWLFVTPLPATLSSLSLTPTSVIGGDVSTGTVILREPAPPGGAVVALSSSDASVVTIPANVTVAGGATSAQFPVSTTRVTSSTAVTISATFGGATKSAVLTVTPAPLLSSVSLNPTSVRGGSSSTGTVNLGRSAPTGGAVITLSSSNPAVATVPASVTVAAGTTSATFTVATSRVTASTTVTVSAAVDGVTRSEALTVTAGKPK